MGLDVSAYKTIRVLCECNSYCLKTIELPTSVYGNILHQRLVVIVDGCQHGPEPADMFVENRDGYSLWREQRDE